MSLAPKALANSSQHWDSLERPVPLDAARGPGKTSTRMHVDGKNQALYISGTILDTISVINKAVLEKLQVTEDGVNMWRFVRYGHLIGDMDSLLAD